MSGGSSGGEAVVQSGPTIAAANQAAQAQIQAAQVAGQYAQQNTNAAINALMNEYSTGLQYAQPSIFTGNQAAAQLNYMLGLPAVSPGAAPTAPTAPNLQYVESTITPAQEQQYVQENMSPNSYGFSTYTGAGSQNANAAIGVSPSNVYSNGVQTADVGVTANDFLNNPGISQSVLQNLAQQQLSNPTSTVNTQYNTALQSYNQQMQAYNNEQSIYNRYNSMGQATPANISDVVQNLPGFQFQQQQGIQGIQNAASASGMLNSGSLLQQLNQFGQGLASTYYNNYLGQLQGLAGYGQSATNQAVQSSNALGSNISGLQENLGNNLANSALAAGQAMASSYLTPLANQQTNISMVGQNSGLGSALGGVGSIMGSLGGSGGLLSSLGGLL